MKKTRFSENLFVKMMFFGIIAFSLLSLSGRERFEYVVGAPREADYYGSDNIFDEKSGMDAEMEESVSVVASEEVEDEVSRPERVVFLTIDDGPSRYTLDFLAVLAEMEVSATFFLIGQHIEDMLPSSQKLLYQVLVEGHYLGLHSMTHNQAALYQGRGAAQRFVTEMTQNQALIYRLTGHHTNLCRPPFGSMGNFTEDHYTAINDANINCINWNVDPRDWQNRDAQVIYQSVRERVYQLNFPSELVVLIHETSWTLEALPDIITFLLEHDYVFEIYTSGFEFRYTNYR